MPSPLKLLNAQFAAAAKSAFGVDVDPLVAPAADARNGDYQSNVALSLPKLLAPTGVKTNPRAAAQAVVDKLNLGELADDVSVAGPGFVNVKLNPAWVSRAATAALESDRLGVERAAAPQTVVVDYGGPNVAKQMHVGHLRSTILGDALVRTLAFLGHDVIRQNHVGDWGTQFGMLIARLAEPDAGAPETIEQLEALYVDAKRRFDADPAFADRARASVVALQGGDAGARATWQRMIDVTRAEIEPMFARLGVLLTRADERGESTYNDALPAVVADLRAAGVAEESDGATIVRVAGTDAPLIVQKSDGGYGYATTDLAAVRHRVGTLKADRVVYVVGNPQGPHFAGVFDAARRAGFAGAAELTHVGFGNMLGADGKMFRTRTGGTVKLRELLDEAEERALQLVSSKNAELPPDRRLPDARLADVARAVGVGAVKYFDLSRDRTGDYKFGFDAMLSMDGNTAPYLQYAHARVRSIFRRAGDVDASAVGALNDPTELALAKFALRFGDVVDAVGRDLRPHVLCAFLYELAGKFSAFYEACPVLDADPATRASRLALCALVARTLATGLDLLGIEHPEQM